MADYDLRQIMRSRLRTVHRRDAEITEAAQRVKSNKRGGESFFFSTKTQRSRRLCGETRLAYFASQSIYSGLQMTEKPAPSQSWYCTARVSKRPLQSGEIRCKLLVCGQ